MAEQRGEWWREAVLYEIYVRSFADSDGDGIGDLAGVRSRLRYVAELGVDGIWLTPFFPSPGVDHGYDVSDYRDVDPLFGSLEELDRLLADAHELGLRVVIDVVPNHTSSEHPWFRQHRDWYVFAPGRDHGPPNNWLSVFGGRAWTRDDASGEWYLHLFAAEQPDLDWHNLGVQAEFERILRFWLDRGVDGLRIDVAHGLFKDPELRDEAEPVPGADARSFDRRAAIDRPEVHPLYRSWRRLADSYPDQRVLVGEVFLTDPARVARYVRPDELHLAFNFALLWEEWDAAGMRAAIHATLDALGAVGAAPTWVLENHDVVRLPTRYGSRRRARAAALLLLALPGTVFLYAGQELGLEEADLADEHRRDPLFARTGGARKGRDGCRIPLPWTQREPGLGFTSGKPWLPVPPEWAEQSVEAQREDPHSMLELYREALARRRELAGAPFAWLDDAEETLSFARGHVVCTVNAASDDIPMPGGELLLASEPGLQDMLPPDTAAWVRTTDDERSALR